MPGLASELPRKIYSIPEYDILKTVVEPEESAGVGLLFEKPRLGTPIPALSCPHHHPHHHHFKSGNFSPGILFVSSGAAAATATIAEKVNRERHIANKNNTNKNSHRFTVPTHLFLTNNNINNNSHRNNNNWSSSCVGGGAGLGGGGNNYEQKYHEKLTSSTNNFVVGDSKDKTRGIINIYEHIVCPETEIIGGGGGGGGLDSRKMEKIATNFRERVSVTHVEMPRKDIWKSLGAEFVSTFILMVVGVGVGMYVEDQDKPSIVAVALCWGFTVASLAQAFGHISGCHMNPAVTISFLVTRKIELVKSCLYIVTQCISAIVAVAFLKALLPETAKGGWGVIGVHASLTPLQGFGLEFLMTFVLIFLIFSQSDENRTDLNGSNNLAVGLCIVVLIFFGANLTGTGLNPARALGPAVVEGIWDSQWIYWVGPIGGGLVAAILYENVFRTLRPEEIEAAVIAKQLRAREQEEKEAAMPAPPV